MPFSRKFRWGQVMTIEREVGADPKADIAMAIEFLKARI